MLFRIDMVLPLISCIVPTTASRNALLPLLLRSFLLQDYPNKELVVISEDFVPLPADPRIRFVKTKNALIVGLKRNAACEAARGEIIAHFDSDDYSAPTRLSSQYEAMCRTNAQVTGYCNIAFYGVYYDNGVRKEEAFKLTANNPAWACGTSLMYRKSYWQRHLFQSLQVGEDTEFVKEAVRRRAFYAVDGVNMMVAFNHPANTENALRFFRAAYNTVLPVGETRERIFPTNPPELPMASSTATRGLSLNPACNIDLVFYFLQQGQLSSRERNWQGQGFVDVIRQAKEEITQQLGRGKEFAGIRCSKLVLTGADDASGEYLNPAVVPAIAYLVWFGDGSPLNRPQFPEVLSI